jgi:hypothetical protein
LGKSASNGRALGAKKQKENAHCPNCAKDLRHIDPQRKGESLPIQRTEIMKTNTRFIKSVVETAAKNDTVMPWARGTRRAAFIAKRNAPQVTRKSA